MLLRLFVVVVLYSFEVPTYIECQNSKHLFFFGGGGVALFCSSCFETVPVNNLHRNISTFGVDS